VVKNGSKMGDLIGGDAFAVIRHGHANRLVLDPAGNADLARPPPIASTG
jgi:hypothetical protein